VMFWTANGGAQRRSEAVRWNEESEDHFTACRSFAQDA